MSETGKDKFTAPKISVIIPFYNREKFLAEAVASVAAQTFTGWELILIDDGSTDESLKIAREIIQKNPQRMFLYQHESGKNRGASASRNLGIKFAKGEFVTFLDSDDVFLPDALELEINAFQNNPEADAVCGTLQYWFSWTNESGKTEKDFTVNLGLETEKLYQPPKLLIHNLLAGGRKPNCMMLKSEFIKRIGAYEEEFTHAGEDQVVWGKVCLNGQVYVVDACINKYRQHPDSICAEMLKNGTVVSDWKTNLSWLESYLIAQKIENPEIWEALKFCRKENDYKGKYNFLLNIYRRVLPYHLRYKIRDFIIKRRTR